MGTQRGRPRRTFDEAFWPYVDRTPGLDGCWVWTGSRDWTDYGRLTFDGKTTMAHRLSWSHHNGQLVPAGMFVLHRCDNPPCVNPDHLYCGTKADNMRDRSVRGRCRAKLSEAQVREIRVRTSTGKETRADIARAFRVTASNIYAIERGTTWKHLT